jgi:hypothetical protein
LIKLPINGPSFRREKSPKLRLVYKTKFYYLGPISYLNGGQCKSIVTQIITSHLWNLHIQNYGPLLRLYHSKFYHVCWKLSTLVSFSRERFILW